MLSREEEAKTLRKVGRREGRKEGREARRATWLTTVSSSQFLGNVDKKTLRKGNANERESRNSRGKSMSDCERQEGGAGEEEQEEEVASKKVSLRTRVMN